MLFSNSSLLTMLHGVVLSGGALVALTAALFVLWAMPLDPGTLTPVRLSRSLTTAVVSGAVLLWLAVLVGTYVVFPIYRLAPGEGAVELAAYPRALLLSLPDTEWLHSFAMEVKEHTPWIAGMSGTAAAFISVRYRATLLSDTVLRRTTTLLLAASLLILGSAALLGVFVNKVAPVW